jgi:hypothetical protein
MPKEVTYKAGLTIQKKAELEALIYASISRCNILQHKSMVWRNTDSGDCSHVKFHFHRRFLKQHVLPVPQLG